MSRSTEKRRMKRRQFMTLLGGGGVLMSGLVRQLSSRVHGQVPEDGCFVLSTFAHGTAAEITAPGSELQFAQDDFALEDIRGQVSTVEDTYNPHDLLLHGNYQSLLCASPGANFRGQKSITPGARTLDRHMARQLSAGGSNRSINLGYDLGRPTIWPVSNASGDDHGVIYPVIADPMEAIATYFGEAMGGDDAAERARILATQRLSVLDFMSDDIRRLNARLATSEQVALDQYLSSVRDLENEAMAARDAEPLECESPEWPHAPFSRSVGIDENYMNFMYDFTGTALACGVTRVASIHGPGVGSDPGTARYSFAPDRGNVAIHDGITHHLREEWAQDYMAWLFGWRAGLVRRLWAKLEGTPVGDATLADNSLLLWVNAQGRVSRDRPNNHYNNKKLPSILVGTAGGRIRSGQAVRFAEDERCIGDVFATVAHAFGDPLDGFGDPEHFGGPVTELLA